MTPKSTAGNVATHLRRFATWVEAQNTTDRRIVATRFNDWMDDLVRMDAFGTENDEDPRQEQRR